MSRDVSRDICGLFHGRELLLWATALFLLFAVAYVFSIDIRASRGASITGDEPFYDERDWPSRGRGAAFVPPLSGRADLRWGGKPLKSPGGFNALPESLDV